MVKNNVFIMWTNEVFIKYISWTNLFNKKLKNNLIKYIEFLNDKQKLNLIQALKNEKFIIINFLRWLKNKNTYSFEEIKTNIEKIHRKNKKLLEQNEEKNKHNELNNLLNTLDNI
jgi:hypothetical protein